MYGFVQKFLPLDSKLILKITTLFEGKKTQVSHFELFIRTCKYRKSNWLKRGKRSMLLS